MSTPDRHTIRLPGYDYSQAGAYFVTIVTQGNISRFGEIRDGEMHLNDAGRMVQAQWLAIPARFMTVELDEFIIMPNHFHAILFLVGEALCPDPVRVMADPVVVAEQVRAGINPAPTGNPTNAAPTIGTIIGAFKSISTHEYICGVENSNWQRFERRLWQRNYYEHIIRDPKSLDKIRDYIRYNPLRWEEDRENPGQANADVKP